MEAESQGSPYFVESSVPVSAGVEEEEVELSVVDDAEYVAMAIDKNAGFLCAQNTGNPRCVVPGVTPDMAHVNCGVLEYYGLL